MFRYLTRFLPGVVAGFAWVAPVQAAEVLITEFMAVNDTGIRDEDGDREDWIELHNAGRATVDLAGWYLTDDAAHLTQWKLPPITLAPGTYRVVWASAKDRDDPDQELHTNFKLSSAGEYLGLVRPDGTTVEWEYAPGYPPQVADVSFGIGTGSTSVNWIVEGASCRALVPADDSLGTDWHDRVGFDDSSWAAGSSGVGYERSSGYGPLISLDVEAGMFGTNRTAYIRMPFVVTNPADITYADLKMKYDDGFAAFINGSLVADALAPAALGWNSGSTSQHNDAAAVVFEEYLIPRAHDYLQPGTNMLAIHGLNTSLTSSDFLIVPRLSGSSVRYQLSQPPQFFAPPSPGAVNTGGEANRGPHVAEVRHHPPVPEPGEGLTVTAKVTDTGGGISAVSVSYRIMYGPLVTSPMADDGLHGDGAAGDGVYGGSIPSSAYAAGEMVRYFVSARDAHAVPSRIPLFLDRLNSPEFFGTVVADTSILSSIPVLHWYVQNPSAADTVNGTRCSLFFNGMFYDNLFCRTRGGSTSALPRPSHKFDFNTGYHFEYDPGERRVEELNLNTTYSDKTYLRRVLAWESFAAAGAPACKAFPMHVRQNGSFYSTDIFVEQVDEDYLVRNGLDPCGALYKMFNPDTGAFNGVEKKTRLDEDHSDLDVFITNINAPNPQRETYLLDYVDLASVINSFAVNNLLFDSDWGRKNHYLYRDSEGTEDWTMLPWDKDLTFGMFWNGNLAEPLLHDEIRGWNGSIFHVSWNKLAYAIYDSPVLREMYLRRLRSVADQLLNPPSTPATNRWYDLRMDAWLAEAGPDFLLDYEAWGNPWPFGDERGITPAQANAQFTLNEFLNPRRSYLYGLGSLPAAQPAAPPVQFGAVLVTPNGDQDEEYIELVNPNGYAVDLSGWALANAVSHTFPNGTVIPSLGSLYVTPDRVAFRRRATSPTGGEMLVVQGNYRGHLSAWGETLDLRNADGTRVATTTWGPAPSPAQQFLRITEIMYHPRPGGGLFTADDFEFVELQNIGPDPLDIAGVHFGGGIGFAFTNGITVLPPGAFVVLVSNGDAFDQRYHTNTIVVAGQYCGLLSNAGEAIKLEDSRGETILEFTFGDGWVPHTDGEGFSLAVIDAAADRLAWDEATSWRASRLVDGSPGAGDTDVLPGSIVINEVLAHSDVGMDWIELKNTTPHAISIGGWFLSDSDSELQKYRIPDLTVIPASGFLCFDESVFNDESDPGVATPFALSELGEQVTLASAADDGTLHGFRATRSFGASDQGVSFGTHLTSDGRVEFVSQRLPTPGATNAGPWVGPIVISEIMYHPVEGQDEFIELYNAADSRVALYHDGSPTDTWEVSGAMEYAMPLNTAIPAGGYLLVVGTDPVLFRSRHAIPPAVEIVGPFAGALENGGDDIRLRKPGNREPGGGVPYILVERVAYNDEEPWPVEADGGGFSLQRIHHQWFADDPASWGALGHPPTPGAAPIVDENRDGLPDVFQFHWFGGTNVAAGGGTDDFDGDGDSNRDEYLSGSLIDGIGGELEMTISVRAGLPTIGVPTRKASGPGYFGLTRRYSLEAMATPAAPWVQVPAASGLPATGQPLEIPLPATDSFRWIRARAWLE